MRGIRSLVVAVLVLSVGCGGKAAPPPEAPSARAEVPVEEPAPLVVEVDALPEIPATPQPAPTELMGTATVGDPVAWIGDLATYADAVRPGIGAMVTPSTILGQLAGFGTDLSGIDLARPVRVLVLDPTLHPMPLVAVVGVADDAALRAAADQNHLAMIVHGDWAAIGEPGALRAAAPYALTTAVATVAPRELTVTIELAAAVTRFRPMLDAWVDALGSSSGTNVREQLRLTLDALAQLDRVVLRATSDRDRVTVTTELMPRADSSIARFVAQQRPGTFMLLERLAAAPVVFGGRVDHTVLFAALMDGWKQEMASLYGGEVAVTGDALFSDWPTMMTDEHAVSVTKSPAGMTVSGLWTTAVGAKVQALVLDYLVALAGPKTAAMKPKRSTYRGVSQTRIDLSGAAAVAQLKPSAGSIELQMAAPGAAFVLVSGADGAASLRSIIDAVLPPKGRKPAAVAPGLAAVLSAARTRSDSYVIAADLPGLAAMNDPSLKVPPSSEHAALTFGFGGGAIVMRMTVPPSQIAPLLP